MSARGRRAGRGRWAAALAGCLLTAGALAGAPGGQLWQDAPPAVPPGPLGGLSEALAELVARVRPALVRLRVRREGEAGAGARRTSGSGFFVHPDGYLVTNAHVVEGAGAIEVRLASGRVLPGTVVGRDRRADVALVRVRAGEPVPVLPLGDSDRLRPGELVLALGHPFGLEQSVSLGVVSRAGAAPRGLAPGFDVIQTDAAVHPGQSGGPLVNVAGHVVGVTTLAARGGAVGFAVPASLLKAILSDLLTHGRVEWGWLGVRLEELTPERVAALGLPAGRGVAVDEVLPGQPAAQAGLRAQDVILAMDGQPVAGPRDLQRRVGRTPPGADLRLRILREGQEQEVVVRVGRAPEEPPAAEAPEPPR